MDTQFFEVIVVGAGPAGATLAYELAKFGSLLPDIIDKPVGQILLQDSLSNGRIFCHTLLFLIIISVAGICLYQRKKNWLLVLSFGTFTHLIFNKRQTCSVQ